MLNSSTYLTDDSFSMTHVPYRGRFAPSPTGPLHLGSMLAAFGSWLLARRAGGQWLVRIEDVDTTREVTGAAAQQLATLSAFALESDLPVERQTGRTTLYETALRSLQDAGHAFVCHCSRTDLHAQGGIHRYCVEAPPRSHPAVRLRVADGTCVAFTDALQGHYTQDVATAVGDFVLRRADRCWAYQLAVVVDDAQQGITHVVRGADLLDSTPRQILLQRLLGLPTPQYLHLPLLLDEHGRKLSKSMAALPVDPYAPLPVLRLLWQVLGQPAAALAQAGSVNHLMEQAVRHFDPTLLQPCTESAMLGVCTP